VYRKNHLISPIYRLMQKILQGLQILDPN